VDDEEIASRVPVVVSVTETHDTRVPSLLVMETPVSTPPPPPRTGVAVYVRFRPLSAPERSPTSTLRSGVDAERCVRMLPSEAEDGGGSSPVSPSSSTSSSSSSFKSRRRSATGMLRDVRFLGGDGATDEAQYRFAYDGIMDEESTQVAHAPRLVVHVRCIAGPEWGDA
jgi:hypothetical protein